MTRELVFLLEERSAEALLESLLPRFLDARIVPRLIYFEGKQDLEKQIVRRIRGYQNPNARFIVVRDQDSHQDCIALKQRLLALCAQTGKPAACLVRIACTELETFYLADLAAVEAAFCIPGIAKQQGNKKFRSPDHLGSPSHELRTLTRGQYQKVGGSRELGKHLDLGNTRSPSFRNLLGGVRRMEAALLA
ncbi:DUF4276 family protein [Stenotrophomonas acidaminiphila]|jgi:hypothetical protein|uniref:DUF4276 family protein n=1 Tax=Stenotrophomonas acidaminiphila TaxID=128780 RepID=UPI003BF24174